LKVGYLMPLNGLGFAADDIVADVASLVDGVLGGAICWSWFLMKVMLT
jgi:hypothetical protein